MLKEELRIGQEIYFGRPNGEKTLGKIIKLNPTKALVETLESRGSRTGTGDKWRVPYGIIYPKGDSSAKTPVKIPVQYNQFGGVENLLMQALVSVYSGLSPENLACDGEASPAYVRHQGAKLRRQLKGIQYALGRDVDESEAYDWSRSREEALSKS